MHRLATPWNRCSRFLDKHPTMVRTLLFFVVWGICSYIYYLRFPNNFLFPNFFAEDGQHFTANIMKHGVFGSFLQAFNGYYIFGIYLLTNIGFLLNDIFFGGNFTDLPASLALTSYVFLGLCCALPILLLRDYLRLPYRLAIALLLVLLPMPSFDYGIIGTIGNLKFAFAYIAFLLILYRIRLPRTSKRIIAVDLGILFCAYTTAGVYCFLPLLLLNDGTRPSQLFKRANWSRIFQRNNIALWSGLGLGILAAVQVLYVGFHGTPDLTGYLDEPYQFAKTIEIFIGRSYMYPFLSVVWRHLNDIIITLFFIGALALAWKFGSKRNRPLYLIGAYAIFAVTAVFIVNRTGTSVHFNHYQTSAFDNFFYAQNFIAIVLGVALLSDIVKRLTPKQLRSLAFILPSFAILILVAAMLRTSTTHAPNDFMQYQIGTIQQQTQPLCKDGEKNTITFSVYPFTFLTMEEPRDLVCTSALMNYQNRLDAFGLAASTGEVLNIYPGNPTFSQTFTATHDHLSGVAVFLASYYSSFATGYTFSLRDASCQHILAKTPLPYRVKDNAYRTITFKPMEDSAGKTYCFSVQPTSDASQLALQLSSPEAYQKGVLSVSGQPQNRDVVFQAIYR